MKTAFVTFSAAGAQIGQKLTLRLEDLAIFVHHKAIIPFTQPIRFRRVLPLMDQIFNKYDGFVFCAPCGVAVRAIAPHIQHKTQDPAVVVLDVGARYAVSLLGGHEAGANDLTMVVSNALGAEPVISTTTESAKTLIVGVGCRKGVATKTIIEAIGHALENLGADISQVRLIASATIKSKERGLLEAAQDLACPLRFLSTQEIWACPVEFQRSEFVQQRVGLPAVAEPAALLAGRRTQLILPKIKHQGVTVAIAREFST